CFRRLYFRVSSFLPATLKEAVRLFVDLPLYSAHGLIFQRHAVLNSANVFRSLGSRTLLRQFLNAPASWYESVDKLTPQSIRCITKARQSDPVFSFGAFKVRRH